MQSLHGTIGNLPNGDPFRLHCEKPTHDGLVFGVALVGGPNSGTGEWVKLSDLTNLRKGN